MLGPSFGFYAKYPDEMDVLYEEENPDYAALIPSIKAEEELAELKVMVVSVAEQAEKEAKEFLNRCTEDIIKIIKRPYIARKVRKESPWKSAVKIRKDAENKKEIWIGINIETVNGRLILRGFIWTPGGASKVSSLKTIIGSDARLAHEIGWAKESTVVFSDVPIIPEDSYSIDEDELHRSVIEPFTRIDNTKLGKIFKMINS